MTLSEPKDAPPPGQKPDADMVTIPRTWLLAGGVGLVTFLIGGLLGFVLALTAYQRGADRAVAAVQEAPANAPAPQAAQPTESPARLDNVSVDDDPALGPEDAPVVIVEFSDFRCPYCKRFHDETLPVLLEEYGDQIQIVYRDFPIVGGEQAAVAAECADEQGEFWPYHDALYENFRGQNSADDFVTLAESLGMDGEDFRNCLSSQEIQAEIVKDYNDGRSYGVTGTPTFFINGVRVVGAQPEAVFRAIIEEELGAGDGS